MNNQQKLHYFKQSMELCNMVQKMTREEKHATADIIRDCDIARLMKNSTIQRELKAVRGQHKGKIKLFLTALSKNPFTESGVNALFESWQGKITDNEAHSTL